MDAEQQANWDGIVSQLEAELTELREANDMETAARRTLERRIEDLGWELVNQRMDEARPEDRKKLRRRAHRYWQEDPIVGQAVNLQGWYVFGRGVPKPDLPQSPRSAEEEHPESDLAQKMLSQVGKRMQEAPAGRQGTGEQENIPDEESRSAAEKAIQSFWDDPANKAALTTLQAQQQKETELQLDGEVFFALFDGPQGGAPLVIGSINPTEIVDVITDPDNEKVPLYYKRVYQPLIYDFNRDEWRPDVEPRTVYHRHWQNEPPQGFAGPPAARIADGRIYHLKVNCTSDQQRGNSELRRIMEWAKGYREFMDARLQVARAVAKLAIRVRVDGGPQQVQQVIQALAQGQNLGLTGQGGVPLGAPPNGALIGMNRGVDFPPPNFETGAAAAAADQRTFLGQVAAGIGWPAQYLGAEGSGSLANLTAMELPTLKMVEARQELWRQVIRDLTREALRLSGFELEPVVQMPAILQRQIGEWTAGLLALIQAVDPTFQNVPLKRWVFSQGLGVFGEARIDELVAECFPAGYHAPPPPALAGTMLGSGGAAGEPGRPPGPAGALGGNRAGQGDGGTRVPTTTNKQRRTPYGTRSADGLAAKRARGG